MFKNLITVLTLLNIFGINESKNVLLDLKKLLNEMRLQDAISNRYENTYKLNYPQNFGHKHKSRHHQPPSLLNVQTMNLYMKSKENLEKYLRTESDRICKETGRCGCIGGRCGDQTDELADEVEKIIEEVDRKVAEEKTENKDDDDDSVKDMDDILRCDGERCDDVLKNLIDGADIFFLDTKDLEKKDFVDLTRNNINIDAKDLEEQTEDLYNERIDKILKVTETSAPNPDDFVNHYETVKVDVIKQLIDYIKNDTPLPLKHLHVRQKQLLRNLKAKYDIGLVNENDLKSELVGIVFGEESGSKIYPHYKNNDNIYIPKWHFNSLLQYKKDNLRAQKSLLPLTTQQKERLINKQASPKIIPKLAWRRNMNRNVDQYGIPFNLEVHGLGQINP